MSHLPPLTLDLLPLARMEKILDKAVRRVQLPDAELCWEWNPRWGADKSGYASVIRICAGHRRHLRVNRLIVSVAEGISYAGVDQACHSCDNPTCINPGHVWNGSNSDNQRDMIAKGRQAWTPAAHGTTSKYVSGCRCIPCRTAMLEDHRRRKPVQTPVGLRRSAETRERVRQLYLETGLGQRELAVQVGIPYQTIAKWVLGLRPPVRDELGRFG